MLTPEMMSEKTNKVFGELKKWSQDGRISCVFVDEAHYVRQTDDSFRSRYKEIGNKLKEIDAPLICMSGTMNNAVVAELLELGRPSDGRLTGVPRLSPTQTLFFHGDMKDNINNHAITVRQKTKDDDTELIAAVKNKLDRLHGDRCGMVFCQVRPANPMRCVHS